MREFPVYRDFEVATLFSFEPIRVVSPQLVGTVVAPDGTTINRYGLLVLPKADEHPTVRCPAAAIESAAKAGLHGLQWRPA